MRTKFFFQLLFIFNCISLVHNEAYPKSINLNIEHPSTFQSNKDASVTHLIVSGMINKKTINTLNDLYPNLEELNMQDAKIVAFTDENKVLYPANEIPTGAFNKRLKLKSVILPHGVVKIGKGAFWSCANLEKVVLSDSVRVIDQFAFQLCGKLRQITFPESLVSIGGASFASCPSLVAIKCTSKIPPLMSEWSPFPDIIPNTCVLYVPAESIANYQNTRFLKDFLIKALK